MTHVELFAALRAAFTAPNVKQKEAYGRFAHTLSAASLIGAVTLMFSETSGFAGRTAGLTVVGLICFLTGALLARGE